MLNNYGLVIFDFDGTIADTSKSVCNSVKYTQKKMNLKEITDEELYSHIGPPMEESYMRNFDLKGEELKKAINFHKEYAFKNGKYEVVLYDGLIELLEVLKNNKIKIAIATLKNEVVAKEILEFLDIYKYFDYICGTNIQTETTKSELILKCSSYFNIDSEKVVLIGDSIYDKIGAYESNVDFIAVTYGFGFKNNEKIEAVFVASDINKITNFFITL